MPLTGCADFFGESLISWRSKKQGVVSRFAMASVACEITWVVQLLKDLKIDHARSAMLFCDN